VELSRFHKVSDFEWRIEPTGKMRVPGVLYADEDLVRDMDSKVYEQMTNVATLPGIVRASYAMPDAHWGYGFPIGGVAAFDPDEGGVISAGGVGFDISCGVRTFTTGLAEADILKKQTVLADDLIRSVPAGLGSRGDIVLAPDEMDAMLEGGAAWALAEGYGVEEDLERIEERGKMAGARPEYISDKAKTRQREEMGTLGSGNHYLEVQKVDKVFDRRIAAGFGIGEGDIVVTIHCGSRGLGHQIGTEFLRDMAVYDKAIGLHLPDRELACAPISSAIGQKYLGAMRAAINCALANRQIIGHLTRKVFARRLPKAELKLLFDVSHNTCKVERHRIDGASKDVYVHRKGATRAFGPDNETLPESLKPFGQPVLIGGSMGTNSYILAGTRESEARAFSSACHGAGRSMSRRQASKRWQGRAVVNELKGRGILIRSPSMRGVAEEAPGAYKDVTGVVDAADGAGLAKKVARLVPLVCIKG